MSRCESNRVNSNCVVRICAIDRPSLLTPTRAGIDYRCIGGAYLPQHLRNEQGRLRTHRVTRGLFILRYVASNAGNSTTNPAAAPSIKVSSHDAKDVDLIAWPGASSNELLGPGDGLVLRVSRDTTIAIEVIPSRAGGSVDAELHLEPVSRLAHGGFGRSNNVAPAVGRGASQIEVDGIEILAHVSRRGDVVIPAGEWICGPEYPMAIEGIEFAGPTGHADWRSRQACRSARTACATCR